MAVIAEAGTATIGMGLKNAGGGWIASWMSPVRMSDSIICERAFEFAVRILRLGDRIWPRSPSARHVAKQVMSSGTSIGSNAEEAQEAQTKADYIAKMSVSRKESRETRYWLRLALRAGVVKQDEVAWELDEVRQLRAMIIAAIKTARLSDRRGPVKGP